MASITTLVIVPRAFIVEGISSPSLSYQLIKSTEEPGNGSRAERQSEFVCVLPFSAVLSWFSEENETRI